MRTMSRGFAKRIGSQVGKKVEGRGNIFVLSASMPLPVGGSLIDKEWLMLLARHTQAVFVSAYDQEGYVVWQRG